MTKRTKKVSQTRSFWLILLGLLGLGIILTFLLKGNDIAIFNPKGFIANEQLNLIIFTVAFMMIIAVPTLFLLYFFAWKYRETDDNSKYDERSQHGKYFSAALWIIPTLFVIVLVVVMWSATHRLEPKKALVSDKKPIIVQVVALRWKWLFIYPEHNIATVNYLQVPANTPVQFDLTADETPMSSFWIPHWGGQLYAMTGHSNRLNLIADTMGDYPGSSAEINGKGFAGMKFTARASSEADFIKWVEEVRNSSTELDDTEYEELAQPSENNSPKVYSSYLLGLYDNVLLKYGAHPNTPSESNHGESEH